MKSLTKLVVATVCGVVLFKLIASFVIRPLAMALGLLSLLLKLAVFAAVVYFVYLLVKKPDRERSADGEIVVEVEEVESRERSDEKPEGEAG